MVDKIKRSIIPGAIGALSMSLFYLIVGSVGLPKLNPATMMASMLGVPEEVGWGIHILIGISLAFLYLLVISPKLNVKSKLLKSVIFGLIAFVLATIGIEILSAVIGGVPDPEDSIPLIMIASILGHLVYAIVVTALFTGKESKQSVVNS